MPGVKFNELRRKVSATLGRAAGERSPSVAVGAYQLMSKTFAAHLDLEKHKTPTWKHRELLIVFLIRYPALIFKANKVVREKKSPNICIRGLWATKMEQMFLQLDYHYVSSETLY